MTKTRFDPHQGSSLTSVVSYAAGETNITAEPGQNVTLPCEAAWNKDELIIEWSKPDLGGNDSVALYRDDQFDYHDENPAYKNRVDLQDREMKNRNVSLVLKNVTTNDTGKYECRVDRIKNKRRKRAHLNTEPICNVTLHVSAPGSNDELKNDGGTSTGLIV
ncbi:ICOS ligand-like, partial [Poecilia latipinna]|uniref:ICOS ligand-like n=1 Tax=Poecilia latipinna TaxID=48699 RepID=UPI00072E0C89